jgi:hypothetical protein
VPEIPIPEGVPQGPLRDYLEWLHTLHEEAGWPSSRELAKVLGVAHTTVTRLFKTYPSDLRLATRLAEHLYEHPVRRVVRSERDWDAFHDRAAGLLKDVAAWKRAQPASSTSNRVSAPNESPHGGEVLSYRPGLTLYCPLELRGGPLMGRKKWMPLQYDLAALGRLVTGYSDVHFWGEDQPSRVNSLLVYFPSAHLYWRAVEPNLLINDKPVAELADGLPECREVAFVIERAWDCSIDPRLTYAPLTNLATKLRATTVIGILCVERQSPSPMWNLMGDEVGDTLAARLLAYGGRTPPRGKEGHSWLKQAGTELAAAGQVRGEAFGQPMPYVFDRQDPDDW